MPSLAEFTGGKRQGLTESELLGRLQEYQSRLEAGEV
jgi:hypothetical protein